MRGESRIRKFQWLVAIFILCVTLTGCSSDEEVIRIGDPFLEEGTSGVEIHTDITEPDVVKKLRDIINSEKETKRPDNLIAQADTFFTLDIPKDSVSEIWRYVWYQENGSAILSNEDIVDDSTDNQKFYALTAEQATELKGIIED